jgi:hypothetical protein
MKADHRYLHCRDHITVWKKGVSGVIFARNV